MVPVKPEQTESKMFKNIAKEFGAELVSESDSGNTQIWGWDGARTRAGVVISWETNKHPEVQGPRVKTFTRTGHGIWTDATEKNIRAAFERVN